MECGQVNNSNTYTFVSCPCETMSQTMHELIVFKIRNSTCSYITLKYGYLVAPLKMLPVENDMIDY